MEKIDIREIIKWHEQTFPDATLEDQLRKFDEEYREWKESQTMQEIADMFIVACGVARFDGYEAMHCFWKTERSLSFCKRHGLAGIFPVIVAQKMEKNRKRVWAKQQDGTYHHTNTEE